MKPLTDYDTGKSVTIFQDKNHYIVRLANVHNGNFFGHGRGMSHAKMRFITTLRFINFILVLLIVAGGYFITPKPITYSSYAMAAGLSIGLYIVLDFVIFIVSKLMYRRNHNVDFIFDTKTKTVSFDKIQALYITKYFHPLIFTFDGYPLVTGSQKASLSDSSVFILKETGKTLIELRSGLSQANVDFMFRGGNSGTVMPLLAALNKVRDLTLSGEELATAHKPTSSQPSKPKGKKAETPRPEEHDFNPMD